MIPLIVLVVVFLVLLGARALGVRRLDSWVLCLRLALSVMFLLTASAHWGSRRAELVQMVPPALGHAELLVTLSGLAELAGAIGLLIPRLAPLAAACLAALLLALLPANIHAALAGLTLGGRPVTPLIPRIILQAVFIAALLLAGFWRRAPSFPARGLRTP
jgi:uncharacterized membrane protein